MDINEILKQISAEALPMAAILTSGFIYELILKYFKRDANRKEKSISYSEKLSELTNNLKKSSKEVDSILIELTDVANEREKALSKLESELLSLEGRENEAKKRIEELENIPLPAVEHFAKLTQAGEKKSARRDYVLFGAGVIVSTLVAIVLKILGWA